MQTLLESFGREEQVLLRLRQLFEGRGFRRVKTGKFEEYALYIENKNFLDTESIITFMDLDGKLMALKPDATLSIVKNIPRKAMDCAQKLYYIDEVYRLSQENREYKVHNQIGVELIDGEDPFASLEIIDLALETLGRIGGRFALDISHLGFVAGLLEELVLSHRIEAQLMEHIHAKNRYDVSCLLEQSFVERDKAELVLALTGLHGDFHTALAEAKGLIRNDAMQAAYDELAQVGSVLGGAQGVNLDFSVVNDLDYYNGLIFRGYVEGVPSLVLTGGRYDNLMRRMHKESRAIGFAVSLDQLGTYLKRPGRRDFDLLITYPNGCDYAALLSLAREQREAGKRVRLEHESSDLSAVGWSFETHCRFADGGLEEVSSC